MNDSENPFLVQSKAKGKTFLMSTTSSPREVKKEFTIAKAPIAPENKTSLVFRVSMADHGNEVEMWPVENAFKR